MNSRVTRFWPSLEPVTCRSVRNSPLQTNYIQKEDKESDNRGELKRG
jgi:hypothetical protein